MSPFFAIMIRNAPNKPCARFLRPHAPHGEGDLRRDHGSDRAGAGHGQYPAPEGAVRAGDARGEESAHRALQGGVQGVRPLLCGVCRGRGPQGAGLREDGAGGHGNRREGGGSAEPGSPALGNQFPLSPMEHARFIHRFSHSREGREIFMDDSGQATPGAKTGVVETVQEPDEPEKMQSAEADLSAGISNWVWDKVSMAVDTAGRKAADAARYVESRFFGESPV